MLSLIHTVIHHLQNCLANSIKRWRRLVLQKSLTNRCNNSHQITMINIIIWLLCCYVAGTITILFVFMFAPHHHSLWVFYLAKYGAVFHIIVLFKLFCFWSPWIFMVYGILFSESIVVHAKKIYQVRSLKFYWNQWTTYKSCLVSHMMFLLETILCVCGHFTTSRDWIFEFWCFSIIVEPGLVCQQHVCCSKSIVGPSHQPSNDACIAWLIYWCYFETSTSFGFLGGLNANLCVCCWLFLHWTLLSS